MTDVFSVDLTRCTGCQACVVACKDRSGLPDEVDLIRVAVEEQGACPSVRLRYTVGHCWHCQDPACIPACRSGALRQVDGYLVIDGAACKACGSCARACPFGAIVLLPESGKPAACDGCADEVRAGIGPTCIRACPMRALGWGPPVTAGARKTAVGSGSSTDLKPRLHQVDWRS